MSLHPELEAAMNRNLNWIMFKCRDREENKFLREELYNEVLVNICESNKHFIQHSDVNSDAWIKKIATNVTASYVQSEINRKSILSEDDHEHEGSSTQNNQAKHDLKILREIIENEFKPRDQQIITLHMMHEPHNNIAEIVGMETASVTNRISTLKKQILDHLNRGNI
jgi:RNA polymerase sigma factor (sigma-70 family)